MNIDETFRIIDAEPPRQSEDILRLGAFLERSYVAGPGARAVIWVAGCLRRCPGCMKPDLFSFDAGEVVEISTLAGRISRIRGLDGVTFSGGEPFEQARPLAALSRVLRLQGLNVLVYTGYRLNDLRSRPERFQCLLDEIDLLIDGEYRQDLPGPLLWRGSSNQHIHELSNEVASPEHPDIRIREIQLTMDARRLRISGFPSQDMEKELAATLGKRGILMHRSAMSQG